MWNDLSILSGRDNGEFSNIFGLVNESLCGRLITFALGGAESVL